MREAPNMRFPLLDGVPWKFQHDHGALWEITQHAGASDPIEFFLEAHRNNWTTTYMWELAWAFSWRQRQDYSDMSWVKFLSLLPVGEEWVSLQLKLIQLVWDGMPKAPSHQESAVASAIAAKNPPVPQSDGTGATDSTPAQ